ncbi:MAG: hypothetical protein ACJAVJ_000845 [Planctomycetota bacterium]|jgi:hypothetical protein
MINAGDLGSRLSSPIEFGNVDWSTVPADPGVYVSVVQLCAKPLSRCSREPDDRSSPQKKRLLRADR